MPLSERATRIEGWAKIIARDRDKWVGALIREVGKPRIDAQGELSYTLALLESVCELLREGDEFGHVRYRPHGTVALITPWNNPFAIPIGKIAPALGFGNTVFWKPALPASALARAMHSSLSEVGLDGMVEVVTGDATTGRLVAEWPTIRAVSFTGSVPVGRELAHACGRLMRPLQAELGGNNAAIVLGDADLSAVARDLASAMFSFAGQRCTAIRRVIVTRDIREAFAVALKSSVEALKVGLPADPQTQVGPVITKERQGELLAAIAESRSRGGRVLTGGTNHPGLPESGCWVSPTVMTDLPAGSPVAAKEMFGPLVALMEASDFDEALSIHNRGEHGLLGSLFSNDREKQARFRTEAQAGLLVINQARPAFAGSGPFVGWKASGFGPPEHGRWNRDFYTRVQAVYVP
jgi:acyl-CoA reductase-like NAD-dependent aldehyde dehydrogenase